MFCINQSIPSSIILAYTSKLLGDEKSRYVLVGQGISVGIYLSGIFTLGSIIGVNGIAISLVLAATAQAIFYIICTQLIKNHENKSQDQGKND